MAQDDRQSDAADPTRAIHDLDEVMIREQGAADVRPAPAEQWIGRVLDARYRITGLVGEGGFGFVFRAKHLILGRDVAVKILQSADGADPMERARFERESSMLAALAHPHIVTVTDFGVSESVPYLVMELVEGRSLRALMDEGALTPERTLRIVVQVLKALSYAHERGIVHRDLKPANVLVQRHGGDDHATLLDFGFAKFFGESEKRAHASLTARGTAFGTTGYIAPEQLGSAPIDGRVDLYATAVIVFESIAGRRPFQEPGADPVEELRATLLTKPPSLVAMAPHAPLSAALDPLLVRGLAKDPAARFASATEMQQAFEALLPRLSAAPSVVPPLATDAVAAPVAAPSRPALARGPMLIALIAVPLVLGGIAIGLLALGWAAARRQAPIAVAPPAPAAPIVSSEPAAEGSAMLGPATGDRPPPADPWAAEVPPELLSIRARIESGESFEAADRRTLQRHIRERPWDARPHLLLAYAEREARALTTAIQRYERAYHTAPSSRGDHRMLTDLVVMVSHPTAGERASHAVAEIYGTEALPALDRAVAISIVEPRAHARLRALRERLAAGGEP